MPGGICALSNDPEFTPAVRCSLLSLRIWGFRREVSLGGYAEASFPTLTQEGIATLTSGQDIPVSWTSAVFRGHDFILGPVIARLDPHNTNALPSRSSVISATQPASGTSFFPAVNRNYLSFIISLPRFRLSFRSDQPIVNEATITRIPPYGSVYTLSRPVQFRSPARVAGLFSVSPTVETCSVKLLELENIDIELRQRPASGPMSDFDVTLTNRTSEENIQVSWMIWPEPEELSDLGGVVDLDRTPVSFLLSIKSMQLNTQRWIAIAITKPFTTDAAGIARLPILA
jgi:hypothetical protein